MYYTSLVPLQKKSLMSISYKLITIFIPTSNLFRKLKMVKNRDNNVRKNTWADSFDPESCLENCTKTIL